jgi:hypothetical protein
MVIEIIILIYIYDLLFLCVRGAYIELLLGLINEFFFNFSMWFQFNYISFVFIMFSYHVAMIDFRYWIFIP